MIDIIDPAVESGVVGNRFNKFGGLSFHAGSQTANFENYVQAINLAALIFRQAWKRDYGKMNGSVSSSSTLAS